MTILLYFWALLIDFCWSLTDLAPSCFKNCRKTKSILLDSSKYLGRALALNKLDNIECFKPGGAFYAFPNVTKSKLNGEKFSKIALENYGVALVPGKSFGDFSNNYVRISYANSIENIEKAIYKISKINDEKNWSNNKTT